LKLKVKSCCGKLNNSKGLPKVEEITDRMPKRGFSKKKGTE